MIGQESAVQNRAVAFDNFEDSKLPKNSKLQMFEMLLLKATTLVRKPIGAQ